MSKGRKVFFLGLLVTWPISPLCPYTTFVCMMTLELPWVINCDIKCGKNCLVCLLFLYVSVVLFLKCVGFCLCINYAEKSDKHSQNYVLIFFFLLSSLLLSFQFVYCVCSFLLFFMCVCAVLLLFLCSFVVVLESFLLLFEFWGFEDTLMQ